MEDFRQAGRADGEDFAREHISVRRGMSEAEIDIWLRDLWFRRIPDHVARLRAAGAGQGHLEAYINAVRRGYNKHTTTILKELEQVVDYSQATVH